MNLQTIETLVRHWVTFIKAHEKLVIVAILSLLLLHMGDKVYDAYGKHLQTRVNTDNAQIAAIEAQNAKTQAAIDALKASVDAQFKLDEAKIANARQTIIVKQQQDAALPLPDLSNHWQDMLGLPQGSITPQTNGTVAVTTDAAHTTVSELEKVEPLTNQLSATQDELKGCNEVKIQQDTQITGLKTDIAAEKKGRADDAKLAAHERRKSFWNGTKFGIIAAGVAKAAFTLLAK